VDSLLKMIPTTAQLISILLGIISLVKYIFNFTKYIGIKLKEKSWKKRKTALPSRSPKTKRRRR